MPKFDKPSLSSNLLFQVWGDGTKIQSTFSVLSVPRNNCRVEQIAWEQESGTSSFWWAPGTQFLVKTPRIPRNPNPKLLCPEAVFHCLSFKFQGTHFFSPWDSHIEILWLLQVWSSALALLNFEITSYVANWERKRAPLEKSPWLEKVSLCFNSISFFRKRIPNM